MREGKFSKEGFLEFAGVFTGGDAEKMKVSYELADECNLIKEDDRCELAYKAGACLKVGSEKKNIKYGF